jgi:hypothetical protein
MQTRTRPRIISRTARPRAAASAAPAPTLFRRTSDQARPAHPWRAAQQFGPRAFELSRVCDSDVATTPQATAAERGGRKRSLRPLSRSGFRVSTSEPLRRCKRVHGAAAGAPSDGRCRLRMVLALLSLNGRQMQGCCVLLPLRCICVLPARRCNYGSAPHAAAVPCQPGAWPCNSLLRKGRVGSLLISIGRRAQPRHRACEVYQEHRRHMRHAEARDGAVSPAVPHVKEHALRARERSGELGGRGASHRCPPAVHGHQPARRKRRVDIAASRTETQSGVAILGADAFGARTIGAPTARAKCCTLPLLCWCATAGSTLGGCSQIAAPGAVRALVHRAVTHGEGCTCSTCSNLRRRRPAGPYLAALSLDSGTAPRVAASCSARCRDDACCASWSTHAWPEMHGANAAGRTSVGGACSRASSRHRTVSGSDARSPERPSRCVRLASMRAPAEDEHVRPGDIFAEPAHFRAATKAPDSA